MRVLRSVSLGLILVALVLLSVNVYGELAPNRHPKAEHFQPSEYDSVLLGVDEAFERLDALSASWEAFPFHERMRQTTDIISAAIVHYWATEDELDPDLKIGFAENYVLHIADSFGDSHRYREHENYRDALKRGVGWCSQASRAAADFLRTEHGLTAGIVLLNGHVVAYAHEPDTGRQVLLDPDFGIYFPFDLAYAEANPSVLEAAYLANGLSPEMAARFAGFYSDGGNVVRPSTRYYGGSAEKMRRTEQLTWAIPAVLILVGLAGLALTRWQIRIVIEPRRLESA